MEKLDRLLRNTVEVVTVDELKKILGEERVKAYIGFEPSGIVHIGWKICANKIRDFIECGFDFTILLADWHAYINDKMGGDIEKIRICGKYMEDCFEAMGVNKDKVKFVYASDYVNDSSYWELVLRTAKSISLSRAKRAMDIMGRKEEEAEKDLSKLFYPTMQVSDIFYLDVDVAYGGMDQRRAHMLAREVAKKIGRKTPIALHTPILTGLHAKGRMDPLEAKMSKSKPESMISIHDSEEEVERKLMKAFCPEREIENNPVLEIWKYIIFQEFDEITIERPEKFGGTLHIRSYNDMEELYSAGRLHPLDLKKATAKYVNEILSPIRDYFSKHPQNYNRVKELQITR
ncbi:MAG TPA: tyrosine--tRNA ligase [Thermoplasmatales archaeon]|nr:tyrosine--tRNA ligase [Thermoplasmatales archaeon]